MRKRNRLSPPAILNALAVSSLQVRTTVFSCPLTVGRVLKPYQCLAHRQGYKTYPTTLTLFDGRVCFSVLGDDVWGWRLTKKRIGLRLLDASFGLTSQIAKAYLQKKGTTTIQCARRLKRTCSIRRWYSELRLFPRQSEDVICSSDVCFGRQHPLSQPNIG